MLPLFSTVKYYPELKRFFNYIVSKWLCKSGKRDREKSALLQIPDQVHWKCSLICPVCTWALWPLFRAGCAGSRAPAVPHCCSYISIMPLDHVPMVNFGQVPLMTSTCWGRRRYPGEKEPAQGRLGCNLTTVCLRAAPSAAIHSYTRCQVLAQLTPILQGETKHWASDGGKATWPAQRNQLLRLQPPAAPAAAPAPQRYCTLFPGPRQNAGEYFCSTLSHVEWMCTKLRRQTKIKSVPLPILLSYSSECKDPSYHLVCEMKTRLAAGFCFHSFCFSFLLWFFFLNGS